MTKEIEEAESIHTPREKKLSKTTLLFLAITIHNFPEGLAVGVAFGALASNPSPEAFIGAVGLAIGIGLQNIPAFHSNPDRWKISSQCLLLGIHVRYRRAHRSPSRGSSGLIDDGHPTLRPLLCGWCDDLCSGRRVDPRFPDQRQYRRCDPRSHGWLCHYDDPRCRFGIRIRKGEHQDKLSF